MVRFAKMENQSFMKTTYPYSIYVHIPFCSKRCGYCDFNTYAGKESNIPAYVDALCDEIAYVARFQTQKIRVHTIFFGGGTPSLLTIDQFAQLLKTINVSFEIYPDAEISLEVNPGTISAEYLGGLRELGFNRLSLGIQSTLEDDLKYLGRIHTRADIFTAVKGSRFAGFSNLNLDLIYGLPGQSMEKWKIILDEAIKLAPEHLSLYSLSIEKGTPFGKLVAKGLMELPNPDLAADMYEWASEKLEINDYQQYEISNWAKKGMQCRHNLQYWRNQPYLGFGAGAHGFAKNQRVSNVLRIRDYIGRMKNGNSEGTRLHFVEFPVSPATIHKKGITKYIRMQETLMLGLRLTEEGVNSQEFIHRFGEDIKVVFNKEINELLNIRLVEWSANSLRLTKQGRLLGNQVFMKFVE
jgi:oxygen-independent coproporphyrinogen-3 oxidase